MLIVPVTASLDELVERERKRGPLHSERLVWKNVTWWPYLDCVLNMEPYHSNRRVAVALAVDWVGVERGEGGTAYHRMAQVFNLVHALLSTAPPEAELKEVPGVRVTDLVVQQNFVLDESTFTMCSDALRACRDLLLSIWHGERVVPRQNDPNTVFYQAMAPAKQVVKELMMPEGCEEELGVPGQRKVMGITTRSPATNGAMRDEGFWTIQSSRPFWAPILVAHYERSGGTQWRIVVFDRHGRMLLERRPRWTFVPWVAQLEEHGALDGTAWYLGKEFYRLDAERRMNSKDEEGRDRASAEELEILDHLDRLLPTYSDFDRKFRFDLFCSASMLCHGIDDFRRGLDYARAALALAPNDGRPHICYALNGLHFAETREEALRSCMRGVRLPPIAGDAETVSKTLELVRLELEKKRPSLANHR